MVRIAIGQLNTTVGDLDGNVAKMAEWAASAFESAYGIHPDQFDLASSPHAAS